MIKRGVIIIFLVISLVFTTSCFTFIDDNKITGDVSFSSFKNLFVKEKQIVPLKENSNIETNVNKYLKFELKEGESKKISTSTNLKIIRIKTKQTSEVSKYEFCFNDKCKKYSISDNVIIDNKKYSIADAGDKITIFPKGLPIEPHDDSVINIKTNFESNLNLKPIKKPKLSITINNDLSPPLMVDCVRENQYGKSSVCASGYCNENNKCPGFILGNQCNSNNECASLNCQSNICSQGTKSIGRICRAHDECLTSNCEPECGSGQGCVGACGIIRPVDPELMPINMPSLQCGPLNCPESNIIGELKVGVIINTRVYPDLTNEEVENILAVSSQLLEAETHIKIKLIDITRYEDQFVSHIDQGDSADSYSDQASIIDNYYETHINNAPDYIILIRGDGALVTFPDGSSKICPYVISSSNLRDQGYCNSFNSPRVGMDFIYGANFLYYGTQSGIRSYADVIVHELMHNFGVNHNNDHILQRECAIATGIDPSLPFEDQIHEFKSLFIDHTSEINPSITDSNILGWYNTICPYTYRNFENSYSSC